MKLRFDRPIAHRGLHDSAAGVIENSRSAFEAAIAAGYAIECDVQLSSDGIPMIFHDSNLDRLTAATGPVVARTIAELTALPLTGSSAGDCPQRFDDFLVQIAGRTLLQIELKTQPDAAAREQMATAVAVALSTYRGPVAVESFDPHLLVAARRAGIATPLGIITHGYDEPDGNALSASQRLVLRHLLHWPWSRFDFISCRDNWLTSPAIRLFRALGMPVTAWTIKSEAEARRIESRTDQIVFERFKPQSA
jgi:glycerophosphoryl diester phosphodiesterase